MKKYLMMGIAALALASCSKDDITYINPDEAKYEMVFVNRFGTPNPNHTWGFGSSTTRAAQPSYPDYRSKTDITEPTAPTFYQTFDEVTDAGIAYAGYIEWNNGWDAVSAAYIDEDCNNLRPERTNGKTFYVNGDVKYWNGVGNGDNNQPVTFVVLKNSTLHLGCVGLNMRIYLAEGATLDVTKKIYIDWSAGGVVKETEWDGGQFTLASSNAFLYMGMNSNFIGNNVKFFNGCTVLNDGGTITANYLYVDQNTTLWNKGTVTVTETLQGDNVNAYIYNDTSKSIKAKKIRMINNYNLLVNYGTIEGTDSIVLHNKTAELINEGTMKGGAFSSAAGGKCLNNGTVNLSGKTDLTNSNSAWRNQDGTWETGSIDIDNYSDQNFNNCKLIVHGTFFLNRGTFSLDAGASVICDSFTWEDTSDFYMGANSLLQVKGTLLTNNYNSGYGFRGPKTGTDYAVIQANKIDKGKGDVQYSMSYFGNLFIATTDHFAQGALDPMNGEPAQPYYYYEPTVKFKFNNQSVSIPANGNCSPGYTDDNPNPDPTEYDYRVMAEDLSTNEKSDFDFNDIVFDVKYVSSTTAKVKVRAAGGIYPIIIDGNLDYEIHALLGATGSTLTMMNTYKNHHYDFEAEDIEVSGSFGESAGSDEFKAGVGNIKIEVSKDGGQTWVELKAPKGKAASKIGVPVNVDWCDEYQDIDKRWGVGAFAAWVQNEQAPFWTPDTTNW